MKPSDIGLLHSLSRPTVHPSGSHVVVAVSRPDLASDSYVGQLWSVELPDGEPRRITRGQRDSAPQFSPDGRLIAFLRSDSTGPAQLVVMAQGGGEPMTITDRKLGVISFRWSPDSTRIAFLSREPEAGRYGTIDGISADAEAPRHLTHQRYLSNGVGYLTDRPAQVFIVDVPDVGDEPAYPHAPTIEEPEPVAAQLTARQLTFDDADHSGLAFSPDGTQLAMVASLHSTRRVDIRSDVWLLDVEGTGVEGTEAMHPLTSDEPARSFGALEWAPTGTLYALADELGETARDFVGRATSLYSLDTTISSVRRLTGDTLDLGEVGSDLTLHHDDILVQSRERGRVRTVLVEDDGTTRQLGAADVTVTGQSAGGDAIVVSFADARTAGDLALISGDRVTTITDFSAALRDNGLSTPAEITVAGRDGYPVHGWVMTPAGEGPHPVLLNIHGGPFAQYSVAVMDEFQVYVDAGYAVVYCNPRGAAGYGEAHARIIRGAMGTVDFDDVIDFLEGTLGKTPHLDAARIGIMGGSYGGYLTAWTIAHDHRFAAAIVERGFLDPVSFVGTSDIGFFFGDEYAGTDAAALAAQSPMAHVEAVTTPTLVIHSENDFRCPLEQGQRYFAAMQRNGVDSELLIFPGENHELSRSGRPRHRSQRFDHILDWWARYLPTAQNTSS